LSCSKAPEGFARWSLRLLADKMVALKHVDHISHKTIRRALKKKRDEALESNWLGDTALAEQPLCDANGKGTGWVQKILLQAPSSYVHGGVTKTTDQGNAQPNRHETCAHTKAWQLAEYGRNRIKRAHDLVPQQKIDNIKTVEKEIKEWQKHRNNKEYKINWRFTNEKARIKLKRLYPTISV
jgi:hypothetical protein